MAMIVTILMSATISLIIYLDSRKRLGKPKWGWIIGVFIILFLFFGARVKDAFTPLYTPDYLGIGRGQLIFEAITSLIGTFLGTLAIFFLLYRIFTRKARQVYLASFKKENTDTKLKTKK